MSLLRAIARPVAFVRPLSSPAALLARRANSSVTAPPPEDVTTPPPQDAKTGRISRTKPPTIPTPLISDLPARWESLPIKEQAALTVKIWKRQTLPWTELTLDEKRASFYISYGPWGPRKPMHGPYDTYKIIGGVILGLAASVVLFATARSFGGPAPRTLNRQWQEASDERYNTGLVEPFRGKWSLVQSDPVVDDEE
ncbi:cytochrome c oxidase subunit IV-domain-containing protein [Myxozyma melibiosi]|uniref:Cytochrome c oxidase subunit IV-domain-containing protein n=1 Tax=Myxozyma melibiosi TaxID=54550 RepID=A0ABR1F0V4_9ASCO